MAGVGYHPQGRDKLEDSIEKLLGQWPDRNLDSNFLIAPHGPLPDSGKVAGRLYRSLDLEDMQNVVVLGGRHSELGPDLAVTDEPFSTPFGKIEVDNMFTKQLYIPAGFERSEEAFRNETFVEMQLVFLQHLLDDFRVVPVRIDNSIGPEAYEQALAAIRDALRPSDLLIVSTNLSHAKGSGSPEELLKTANRQDGRFINALRSKDIDTIQQIGSSASICGWKAAQLGIQARNEPDEFHSLGHTADFDNPSIQEHAIGFGGFCYT